MESEKPSTTQVQHADLLEPSDPDLRAAPVIHAKTIIVVTSVCSVYFAQLMYLVGAGSHARDIAAVVGGTDKSSWISSSVPILAVVLSSPISQAADLWGRKWFLVGLTSLGGIGCVITSRANSMTMAIAGGVIAAASFGAQPLVIAIPSEVLPRRLRPVAQASSNIIGVLGAVFGLLLGAAVTRKGHVGGFRVYWYIAAGLYIASALACALFYNPPPRELQTTLNRREKMKALDWMGYALLSTGLILFCMSLIWSQNPYPWTNAHVLATFLIGITISTGLIIYETKYKRDGIFHHKLFMQSRNFALAVGCIFVEGLVFFTGTYYYPYQVGVLYTADSLLGALRISVSFLVGCGSAGIAGWYCSKRRSLRAPLLLSFVFLTLFNVLMATTRPGSNREVWGYIMIFGFALGVCVLVLISVAQFATPPSMIATATGLLVTMRNLGGAVGLAVYKAVFTHTLSSNLSRRVSEAVLPLGLPASSLKPLITALVTHDTTGISRVPGISKSIIAAGGHAVLEAYSAAFRHVWIVAACFGAVGIVLAYFVIDPKEEFNQQIDAPVEVQTLSSASHDTMEIPRFSGS
ncbi:hypothetical protein LTR84_012786 [Exophiala bonariae]|uniref:Major facilitator superfamily (MFS) profile domain-containing protein n=1 Tax=Exophiala bonariae TaxID=1690606 RepID=A0AAV9NEZ2_9EURO|nr:hypothetical protein LTR84_012786 [Exophiala bonariae]